MNKYISGIILLMCSCLLLVSSCSIQRSIKHIKPSNRALFNKGLDVVAKTITTEMMNNGLERITIANFMLRDTSNDNRYNRLLRAEIIKRISRNHNIFLVEEKLSTDALNAYNLTFSDLFSLRKPGHLTYNSKYIHKTSLLTGANVIVGGIVHERDRSINITVYLARAENTVSVDIITSNNWFPLPEGY